jgi:hypothetical protein
MGQQRREGKVEELGLSENRNHWVESGCERNTGAWDEIQILSQATERTYLLLRKKDEGSCKNGWWGEGQEELAYFPLLWFL